MIARPNDNQVPSRLSVPRLSLTAATIWATQARIAARF